MAKVNAFGKILSFPDDASHEEIESFLNKNVHLLDPNYRQPLTDKAMSFAKDVFGYGKPSISEQAEATAPDLSETVAPKMRGAPVRQTVYNKALLQRNQSDESALQDRINKTAEADLSGQRLQTGVRNALIDEAPLQDPEALDYAKGFAVGSNRLVSGIGAVAEIAGAKEPGKAIRALGDRGAEYWNQKMSIGGKSAMGEHVFVDDENSLIGVKLSDNWANALLMGAAQSMPTMFAAAIPGAAITKGIQSLAKLGLAGGAGATIPLLAGMASPTGVGSQIISRLPSAIGFGAAQGIVAGGMGAASLKSSIESMSDKELRKSPVYIALRAKHGEAEAKQILADQASVDLFGKTALSTGTIGALTGGGALGQAYQKVSVGAKGGVVAQFGKGGALEFIQETPQSAAEKYIENITKQKYLDQAIKPMEGVVAEGLSGGAIGFVSGGIVGGAGAINLTPQRDKLKRKRDIAQETAKNINQQTAQQDISDITKAGSVDEAINAANKAATRKPVTEDDVHRSTEPTLADIERLTGLKPSEAIDTVINETKKQAEQVQAKPTKPGKSSEIVLPDNSSVPYQWDVVDADQIKATLKSGINQPRDRSRASSDIQIQNIAKNPDYRRLSDSPVMDVGSPVITSNGEIVAGNGRFEALDRAYGLGTHQGYIQSLIDDLPSKGIDPGVIEGMSKPVLVRRLTQPVDIRKLAVQSNSGGGLQYSGLELAAIDASRMRGLENLEFNDLGELALNNDNYQILKQSLSGYNSEELAAIQDAGGSLSQDGMRRVRNAVLAKAYGDSEALGRLIETTDNNLRNVLGALTKSASTVAKTKSMIESGVIPKELDITDNLLNAVDVIHNLKSRNIDLPSFLAQKNIFGDEFDSDSREILQYLSDNIRSQRKLTDFIKSVYGSIASIDTKTGNVFGDNSIPTKKEIVKNAKQTTQPGLGLGLEEDKIFSDTVKQISAPKASDAKSDEAIFSRDARERIKNLERTRKLQKAFNDQGYKLTVKASDVRNFIANDGRKRNEAIAAEQIAKALNKRVVWVDITGEFDINGVVVPNIKDTIFIDVKTNRAVHAVLGHELSHHMEYESPRAYQSMLDALDPLIKNHERYAEANELEGASRDFIIKEIVGDLIGDNFTNQKFWDKVAEYNPRAFKRIADVITTWINRLLGNIKGRGLGSERWVSDIEKARDIIAKSVAEYVGETDKQSSQNDSAMFQKAWHGSPHDHGKFDSSKIGTGEGAQAYGFGHYFTDTKDVADYYRDKLSDNTNGPPRRFFNGVQLKPGTPEYHAGTLLSRSNILTLKQARNEVLSWIENGEKDPRLEKEVAGWRKTLDILNEAKSKKEFTEKPYQGKLYEVELAPEQDEYLLWDKPLSEQSEKVKNALAEYLSKEDPQFLKAVIAYDNGDTRAIKNAGYNIFDYPGSVGAIYQRLAKTDSPQETSRSLHSIGIRGVKYLDGSSRSKGEGAYNYVIFDDKDIEITAKFSKAEIDRTLIAQHNLSISNLLHADKVGGLAAPSIAVTDKAHPLKGFGEITLLAEKDLVDPKKGAKTFGSDIYSPRYPDITYKFDKKATDKFNELIADGIKAVDGNKFYGQELRSSDVRDLSRDPAIAYQFLKMNNIEPDIKYHGDKKLDPRLKLFENTKLDEFNLAKDGGFKKAVKKIYDGDDENGYVAQGYAREVVAYIGDKKKAGKVNRDATRNSLEDQIRKEGLQDSAEEYVHELLQEANPQEKIFQGYTYSGNRKYIEHNIDNVIKLLKKELRGGENFNYGLGTIRSKYAPQFKSIQQIRESKSRLMDSDKFDQIKKEVDKELRSLADELNKYGTFSGFDNAETMLFDVAKMRVNRALEENGFKNVPAELKLEIGKFINKLRDMPTEYFEAKVLRGVGLGEFTAAIIPDNAPSKVTDILKKNGVEDIREYKAGDQEDRVRKINEVDRVMFSRKESPPAWDDVSMYKPVYKFKDGGLATLEDYEKYQRYFKSEDNKKYSDLFGIDTESESVPFAPFVSKEIPAGKVAAPEPGKFLTQENVDNISRAILAVKEKLIGVSSFNSIVEKNLPIPPENERGSNMAGDIYIGSLSDNLNYHFGMYLSGLGIPYKDIISGEILHYPKVNPSDIKVKKDGDKYYVITSKYSSVGPFSSEEDAIKKYSAEYNGRQMTIGDGGGESFYAVGSGQFDREPELYDRMAAEFRKSPVRLLRSVSEDIRSRLDEADADMFFFKEAIKDAAERDYTESPQGRRESFKIIKDDKEPKFSRAKDNNKETISIDGVDRPTRNSESKLIHPTEEGIRNFWEWFGGSKIVDDQGRPLVVFHGGNSDIWTFSHEFAGLGADQFGSGFYFATDPTVASGYADNTKDGANVIPAYLSIQNPLNFTKEQKLTKAQIKKIITGSPTFEDALWNFGDWQYEGKARVTNDAVNSYYDSQSDTLLQSLHPMANDFYGDQTEAFAKVAKKVLGYDGVQVDFPETGHKFFIAWDANQIKSSTGNNGAFSESSDDIRFSFAGYDESIALGDDGQYRFQFKPNIQGNQTVGNKQRVEFVDGAWHSFVSINGGKETLVRVRDNLDDVLPSNEAVRKGWAIPVKSFDSPEAIEQSKTPDQPEVKFSSAEKSETSDNALKQIPKEQDNALPKETAFRKFQREWQDDFNRFQVIKDWLQERGVKLSEKADVTLAEERFHAKVANQIEDFRDFTLSPLIERIAKAGFTMQDVADFLEAQHAPEANAQIQKLQNDPEATAYGVTDEEAKAYLDKATPGLKKLANEFRDIAEQAKKLRLDNGLLNKDITGAWEAAYKHYIPVKGAEEQQPGSGKGLSVKFKPKRRLGHGRRDEAVVENIIHDYERAVFEVEKNRVGKHLVMMAAEISNPDLMTIEAPVKRKALRNETAYQVTHKGVTVGVFDSREAAMSFKESLPLIDKKIATGEVVIVPTTDQRIVAMASPMLADNEINVYIDGHAIRLQINDDLSARAYKKLGVEGFGKLVAAGRALNGYLSKVYTGYNPEFILKNLQRDFQTGLINLTGEEGFMMAAKAAYNYPKMFADLFRYVVSNRKNSTKWIDQYRATGGNTGAAYLSDMERLGKEVATEYAAYQGVMSNLKQGKPGFAARAAGKKAYNVFLKWIYNMNQAGENAMRLAAFKAMIDSGRTENEAAHIAKNITVNFNRKGENGQTANAAWLFFNASVQGQSAMAHALFKGKHKGQAWALASAYATIGYLAAASLGGGDEDDYDKIDDYTKERNLLISDGDGGWVKIAVPYGYGFFYNTGRALADAQRKDDMGLLPWHIMSSAIEEMTPFGDIVVGSDEQFKMDQVLMGAMPTAIKIPGQVAFNKQLFSGGELMPESEFDQSQPDREKMFRGTRGTVYDELAGRLQNIGFDVSPETLKYSFRTGTGGAGALVDTTISSAMLKSQGAELDTREIPFLRGMYHENDVRADRAAFHKTRKEAQTAAEELNRAIKKKDFFTAKEIITDKKEMIAMDKYADKLRKLISIERDAQDSVRLDPNLSAAEKRTKLKEMEKRESEFYDKYLDVFKTKKSEMKSRND